MQIKTALKNLSAISADNFLNHKHNHRVHGINPPPPGQFSTSCWQVFFASGFLQRPAGMVNKMLSRVICDQTRPPEKTCKNFNRLSARSAPEHVISRTLWWQNEPEYKLLETSVFTKLENLGSKRKHYINYGRRLCLGQTCSFVGEKHSVRTCDACDI